MRQLRAFSALLLACAASTLGVFACDNGTFDSALPVYQGPGPATSLPDSSTPVDATSADAQTDAADAAPTNDSGDASTPNDGGDSGAALDGALEGGDAETALDATGGNG